MVSDPTPPPSSAPRPGAPQALVARFFLNEWGLRPGWSILLYVGFWYAGQWTLAFFLVNFVLPFFPRLDLTISTPANVLLQEIVGFASAYGAALLMARIEQCDAGVYGLPWSGAFRKSFWQGIGLGLLEVGLLMALIAAFGGYSFGGLALSKTRILGWGALWAVAFLFVGFAEEFLFRGYVQYRLTRSLGFWPAAVFLSLLFGAFHLANPGEGIAGIVSVAVTGIVFAFALRRTGNLWLAVGWHASYDFGETFLFSVPDSGVLYDKHLSNATLHGPAWLTGGSIGPEGSVFSFVTLGISAVLIHLLFPARKSSQTQA